MELPWHGARKMADKLFRSGVKGKEGRRKSVDLKKRKEILRIKYKDKSKNQLTNADVFEYVKEIMANELGLADS
jgi:hypothetical protein